MVAAQLVRTEWRAQGFKRAHSSSAVGGPSRDLEDCITRQAKGSAQDSDLVRDLESNCTVLAPKRGDARPSKTEPKTPELAWYEGGTLHKKTLKDWNAGVSRDWVATCADFISTKRGRVRGKRAEVDQLVACINAVAADTKLGDRKVADIAATCMLKAGY